MIPSTQRIIQFHVYQHDENKELYTVTYITDRMKINGVWSDDKVISYRGLGRIIEYARFEKDFREKFSYQGS